ncbi:hypothetical protein CRT23_25910 [Methylobacterium sp. V23]|nr:hypothetical protein CRT23_25910 [Methylobacterium sp. V23]
MVKNGFSKGQKIDQRERPITRAEARNTRTEDADMADTHLIALGHELDALAKALDHYAATGGETGEAEAAEEDRLWAWSDRVLDAIATERSSSPEGLAVKLQAIEHLNRIGDLTPADRITDAETKSDVLAWAIVRDLVSQRTQAA